MSFKRRHRRRRHRPGALTVVVIVIVVAVLAARLLATATATLAAACIVVAVWNVTVASLCRCIQSNSIVFGSRTEKNKPSKNCKTAGRIPTQINAKQPSRGVGGVAWRDGTQWCGVKQPQHPPRSEKRYLCFCFFLCILYNFFSCIFRLLR